ncbi:MAG: SDR family NAD(P)-dependent oxidoreductase [Deltaproteobacteria bacterium]|nr:SDR family NAD(P)-dependent oxidoreductase [Deltaproteobacteria bacterium]
MTQTMAEMRTVLVTGAGRGLGRALALHLAAPGVLLFLHYNRSADGARETSALARQKGAQTVLLEADLSRSGECSRLAEQAAGHAACLHLLIHNAGAYPESGLLELPPGAWDETLGVTLSGVYHLTRAALPLLRGAAGEGGGHPARVILIGDSGADRIVARDFATPYHIAKVGAHILMRSFARVLTPEGITVNQISPGFLENSVGEVP